MEIRFNNKYFVECLKEKIFEKMNSEKRRISVKEFSKEAGVSPTKFTAAESGKKMNIDTFFKLCHWLNKDANLFKQEV